MQFGSEKCNWMTVGEYLAPSFCLFFPFTSLFLFSLLIGDFYLTKHSNLAEVHAVFHLVTDDNLSNLTINSRHPIMIGVRNIMMAASRCNITNLVIPLLLVHEMSEVTKFYVLWDTLSNQCLLESPYIQ